jgi:hypothetical protein
MLHEGVENGREVVERRGGARGGLSLAGANIDLRQANPFLACLQGRLPQRACRWARRGGPPPLPWLALGEGLGLDTEGPGSC